MPGNIGKMVVDGLVRLDKVQLLFVITFTPNFRTKTLASLHPVGKVAVDLIKSKWCHKHSTLAAELDKHMTYDDGKTILILTIALIKYKFRWTDTKKN